MRNIELNMVLDQSKDMDGFFELFNNYLFLNKLKISVNTIEDDFLSNSIKFSKRFSEEYNYLYFLSYLSILKGLEIGKQINYLSEINQYNRKLFLDLEKTCGTKISIPSGPCIPGNTKVMIDTKGNIYPCEKLSELIDDYKIGTIDKGYDISKIKKLINFSIYTKEQCKNCNVFRACTLCIKAHSPYGLNCNKSKKMKCEECKQIFYDELITRAYIKEILDKKWVNFNE